MEDTSDQIQVIKENKTTTYQKLQHAANAVLREIFMAFKAHIRKQEGL